MVKVSNRIGRAVKALRMFTSRLSSDRGGFFEIRLRAGEGFDSLAAFANHATLQTSQRLLTFRGETASWEERRKTIR